MSHMQLTNWVEHASVYANISYDQIPCHQEQTEPARSIEDESRRALPLRCLLQFFIPAPDILSRVVGVVDQLVYLFGLRRKVLYKLILQLRYL